MSMPGIEPAISNRKANVDRKTKLNLLYLLVAIIEDDLLPKQICFHCYNCLVSFYKFRKLAESIDEKLQSASYNRLYTGTREDTKLGEIKIEAVNYIDDIQPKVEDRSETELNYNNNNKQDIIKCNIKPNETIPQSSEVNKRLLPTVSKTESKDEADDIDNVKFKCEVCSATFKSIKSLSAHMIKHTKKGRILSCSICGKEFKKVSHVKRHEKIHEINRPHKCSVCSKSFSSEDILKEHLNKHYGVKPHTCTHCSKSFAHLFTLKAHLRVHTTDKAFLCPKCGKNFYSSTNFKQHMRRHDGLKTFACAMCPMIFISKGELKSHTITHTGERNCTCDQCGSSFTKNSSLMKHIKLKHLGLKPHQCDKCSMKFTSKDHLKRHYRSHTGEKPYKCDLCERAFSQTNDLVKHRRVHVGDKTYKCMECTQSFRLKYELQQHISEHFIKLKLLNNPPIDGASSAMVPANITDGADLKINK
ncbi:unnamed protein product [Danaus chrysippus]|uniref:(African queen) hypothetical protein n=1 Tax=Danaus chrysippus TaxID=151541 RepID=A0A8J2R5E6_9NEOP|nr:unnamed protein product [Danaus chrysippus]